MFDQITMDYIMEISNRIHRKSFTHLGNRLNVERYYQLLCKHVYMPRLISNSETVKYLHKVGENLKFLFSPMYFIVGFGCHIEL